MKNLSLLSLFFVVLNISCSDRVSVKKVSDSVVDRHALTIDGRWGVAINGKAFQQDAHVSSNGYQYVAYYNDRRHLCLARRKLPRADWEIIEFDDYYFKTDNAHNTVSMGICELDGTIHLAFDHHNDLLNYRVSESGVITNPETVTWDASLFGPVISELEKGQNIVITYPRFWKTPGGGLQFCYRRGGSGRGDRMLVDYDPHQGIWKNTRQIDSGSGFFEDFLGESDSRCSYPNGYSYGPSGILHKTWVWRESAHGANHGLMYAYSDDSGVTWRNNEGVVFDRPPDVNSPGVQVWDIGRGYGLMNTHGQAVDSKDRVHVVMWHSSDESLARAGTFPGEHRWGTLESRRYNHYMRDENGAWHHTEIPWVAGNRPKVFTDRNDNVFLIYGAQSDLYDDESNLSVSEGDLVIASASSALNWSDWRIIHVENGPFVNEMLGDQSLWKSEGILSVMVQEMPSYSGEPTALRILDFTIEMN